MSSHFQFDLRSGRLRTVFDPGFASNPTPFPPGIEFPRWLFHATDTPRIVRDRWEEADFGPEWSRTFIDRPYPRTKYHWVKEPVVVGNVDEEVALGLGWAISREAFAPYRGPRPTRTSQQDPKTPVVEWYVTGWTPEVRRRIEREMLDADAVFERSSDPDIGAFTAMRQGFAGIARALFDARILTEELLMFTIGEFVWECAAAGGWWRFASATRQDIFPERIGRSWIWREDYPGALGLFCAEIRDWRAKLLDGAPDALVDLLQEIIDKKGITIEAWAADNKFGRTTFFDWKAARQAGTPLKGKVSPQKSVAIENAIERDAGVLGLSPEKNNSD